MSKSQKCILSMLQIREYAKLDYVQCYIANYRQLLRIVEFLSYLFEHTKKKKYFYLSNPKSYKLEKKKC